MWHATTLMSMADKVARWNALQWCSVLPKSFIEPASHLIYIYFPAWKRDLYYTRHGLIKWGPVSLPTFFLSQVVVRLKRLWGDQGYQSSRENWFHTMPVMEYNLDIETGTLGKSVMSGQMEVCGSYTRNLNVIHCIANLRTPGLVTSRLDCVCLKVQSPTDPNKTVIRSASPALL